jgi:hypothetical protein
MCGDVLKEVAPRFRTFEDKYDPQLYEARFWVEISTKNGRSLLIGNHNFSPDTKRTVFLNVIVLWRTIMALKITVFL